MAVDLEKYAFSFSHAIIKAGDKQYTGIKKVNFKQDVSREATYGTGRKPQKRSAGQIGMGEGSLEWSDLEEAMQFYSTLGDDPTLTIFEVDITLTNEAGQIRTYVLRSCALSGFEADFESGADALGMTMPFDYMQTIIDGKELSRT
jgi:hypothetical protein